MKKKTEIKAKKPLKTPRKGGRRPSSGSGVGWAIFNAGLIVYPTLSTTRRDCIKRFCENAEQPWKGLCATGMFECRKVSMQW